MSYRSSSPRARDRFRGRRSCPFRPAVEALEDRSVPTGVGWAIDADPNITFVNNWGLALDGQNNSVLSGGFSSTTTFGTTATGGTISLTSTAGASCVAKYDPNGVLLWAENFGGSGGATRVAADASGNIYVAGNFSGTAAFGPFTLSSAGGSDAYVAKLDPSGNVTWVSQIGGTGTDEAWSVAVDASGNVYATGRFNGTASVSLNGGASSLTLNSYAGGQDAFVAKLDSGGNVLWARDMGGPSPARAWGSGITVDPNGDVYATGRFSSTASFGPYSLTSKGGGNGYVTRLDASGNFQWAQRMGGSAANTNGTIGSGIALDTRSADPSTWAVYVTGNTNGTSSDFGSATFSTGGDDAFVTRLDAATGSFTWADQLGGAGQELGYAIAVDGSGNVYTTGGFGAINQPANFDPRGTFTLYPGNGISTGSAYRDAYVSMLDPNGNFVAAWQTTAQATDHNTGQGIAVDSAGDVWASGNFDATTAFPTGQTMPPGGNGLYLIRLNAPHGAVVGTVYDDLNDNGKRDLNANGTYAEPPLIGRTVYIDLNNSGSFQTGDPSAVTDVHGNYEINGLAPGTYTVRTVLPAGWTTTAPAGGAYAVTVGNGFARNNDFGEYTPTAQTTYTQSKATTIKGCSTVQSTLSVSDSYSLLDGNVNVNISYSGDSNLGVSLIAPDGTTVPLASNNGGSGSNFTNTTFDDEAPASISSGSAPFTGKYQPVWPLAVLQGKSVQGTWTLQVGNSYITTGKINSWSMTVTHATSSPQLSAPGVAPGGESAAPALTPEELAPVAQEAVAHWAATGLTAPQLARLHEVKFSIQDLSASGALGLTGLNTPLVLLDATADGWGWFVDPTPADNAEFAGTAGGQELQALPGSPAFGRMDLLTVVEHELGHVLGLDDLDPGVAAHDLMTSTLGTGTRRLLTPAALTPWLVGPVATGQPSAVGFGALPVSAPPAVAGVPPLATRDAVFSLLVREPLLRPGEPAIDLPAAGALAPFPDSSPLAANRAWTSSGTSGGTKPLDPLAPVTPGDSGGSRLDRAAATLPDGGGADADSAASGVAADSFFAGLAAVEKAWQ